MYGNLFKAAYVGKGMKQQDVAKLLGCTTITVRNKVENDGFTQGELSTLRKVLDMREEDFLKIFFGIEIEKDREKELTEKIKKLFTEYGKDVDYVENADGVFTVKTRDKTHEIH